MPISLADLLRIARRECRALFGHDIHHRRDVSIDTVRLGSGYGGWVVHPNILGTSSVVYSFGVGEDISFDVALVERYDLSVHAFDPTPKAMEWIERQALPDSLCFHPVGVAAYDGMMDFHAPLERSFASYTSFRAEGDAELTVQGDVRRVATLMAELGHERIDILKLDVEGSEYETLEDVLASGVDVIQILVEFHHSFRSISIDRTYETLARLKAAGFLTYHVSPKGEEFSFIREDAVSAT